MAEVDETILSDGSDIEVDFDDSDDENFIGNLRNVDNQEMQLLNLDLGLDIDGNLMDSDNENDFMGFDDGWRYDDFHSRPYPLFNMDAGIRELDPPDSTALHYFDLMFNDDIMQLIVSETNRYAPDVGPRWHHLLRKNSEPFLGYVYPWGL
ncbi:unnamed protein product [Owenia fusiformis]|uniref:Uncharacterized protein n=1 Tax=Owenia fusiformis TaxID=6347 RepID=A0A8S4PV27_OWEFU|nr:unnamed protein product [Owenia fusiformis]